MKNFLRRPKEKADGSSLSSRQPANFETGAGQEVTRPKLASTPNSFPGVEVHHHQHHQEIDQGLPRTHSVYSASSVSSYTGTRSAVTTPPTPYTVSTQQSFGFEGLKLADHNPPNSNSLQHQNILDVRDNTGNDPEDDDLEDRLRQFNRDGALEALKNKQWSEAEDYIKEVIDDLNSRDTEDDRADWVLKLAEVQQLRNAWDSSFETVRTINLEKLSSLYLSSKVRLLMADAAARVEKKEIAKLQCVKIIKTCRNDIQLRPFLTSAIQLMTFILTQEGNTKEAKFYQSLLPKQSMEEPQSALPPLPCHSTLPSSSGGGRGMNMQPGAVVDNNDRESIDPRAQEISPSDSASQLHSPRDGPSVHTLAPPAIPRADSFTLGSDVDPSSIIHKPAEDRIPHGHPNDQFTINRHNQNIYSPGRGPPNTRALSYSGPPAYVPTSIAQRSYSMAIPPAEASSISALTASSEPPKIYTTDDDEQYSTLELVDPTMSNFSPTQHQYITPKTSILTKGYSVRDTDLLRDFGLSFGNSNEEIEGKRADIWRAIMAAIESDNNPHLSQVLFRDPRMKTERDTKGYTPLHWAAFHGNDNATLCLLSSGADTNVRTPNDWTPLHWAAFRGNASVAKILLDHGANPNTQIQQGNAPLHYAAQYDHTAVVHVLLQQGALVGIETLAGFTALHCAAQHGRVESVKLLLQWKTDPNHQADCGPTPLHCAAQGNALEVAKILLASGASINRRTVTEKTPLAVASSMKMKSLLKSYGGTK